MLDVSGCMIVADALHCQKETAAAIVQKGADYIFCAKDNQGSLKCDIEDFCRIEDEGVRQVLNLVRKISLNQIKSYKQITSSKLPISKIMFGCLLDCDKLIGVFDLEYFRN